MGGEGFASEAGRGGAWGDMADFDVGTDGARDGGEGGVGGVFSAEIEESGVDDASAGEGEGGIGEETGWWSGASLMGRGVARWKWFREKFAWGGDVFTLDQSGESDIITHPLEPRWV